MVAYEVARGGFLDEHIKLIRRVYGERRDVMLDSLEEHFPPALGVTWTRPAGGLFLWVRLPEGMDSHRLLEAALRQNVAFVPGDAFFAEDALNGHCRCYFRMNFSNAQPEQINEGVRRLSVAVKQMAKELRALS
jgi:2-aminoadipate transaminase